MGPDRGGECRAPPGADQRGAGAAPSGSSPGDRAGPAGAAPRLSGPRQGAGDVQPHRAALLAFTRDTLGKSHVLYTWLRDVRPLREVKRAGHPLTVAEVIALTEQLTPAHAEIVWAMATTGMGPGELWGSWQVLPDRIHIAGTKRAGRVRDVPLLWPLAPPARAYQAFRRALSMASGETVDPYDLRRSYATWLEAAAIPRTRRRLYLGHGARSVTDLYERHQVEAFLAEDGPRLRRFIGERPTIGERPAPGLREIGGMSGCLPRQTPRQETARGVGSTA